MIGLVPVLLERGDPMARDFVLHTAMMADTPELNEVLRAFALGQHGTDEMRMKAAQHCVQAGVTPTGLTRLWLKGEWTDLLLIGFELHGVQPSPSAVSRVHWARPRRAHDGTGAALIAQAIDEEVWPLRNVSARIAYRQSRNHAAYRSHRKQTLKRLRQQASARKRKTL